MLLSQRGAFSFEPSNLEAQFPDARWKHATMPSTLSHYQNANKPRDAIARVIPYHDTIGVSSRRFFPLKLLEAIGLNCAKVVWRIKSDKEDCKTIWRYVLIIQLPSREAFKILYRYKRAADQSLNLYRIHPAFDFEPTEGHTREEAWEIARNHIRLKRHRRDQDEFEIDASRYSRKLKGAKSKPSKYDVFYDDRHSKLTGECEAIHVEPRLETSRATKIAGFRDFLDPLTRNASEVFAEQYDVKNHLPIREKIILRTIKQAKLDYPKPHVDIERRVRAIHRILQTHRLREFHRCFPRQSERLKRWDCLEFDDWQWITPDIDVGEMSSLSSDRAIKPSIKRICLSD
ncbi:hypothetical protein XI06_15700 [Bradyrhizobium sp. CCBAU 11434]|uniref:hypothetical protein n=1 Tax=Bradyrhizobium sp. CCBAU 11434 TaxID=1630885 RepID=UPI002305A745|nr:hypothetical protein [Bradyrhizobium sp. CCBAU 11434]MDA9521726.1 hypothetical protein [Bradyrhizobium sp. CCBAU 11434]